MKLISSLVLLALLAGCAVRPVSIPTAIGHSIIVPTTLAKVGHLYFSGVEGKKPVFQTADGKVWYELCYDDFRKTNALKDLSSFVVDDGVTVSEAKGTLSANASIKVPVAKLEGTAAFSASAVYKVENVRLLNLLESGVEHVRGALGDGCNVEIAKMSKNKNVQIALLTAAQRADKVSQVGTLKSDGGIGPVSGGASYESQYNFDLVYFTGLLTPQ